MRFGPTGHAVAAMTTQTAINPLLGQTWATFSTLHPFFVSSISKPLPARISGERTCGANLKSGCLRLVWTPSSLSSVPCLVCGVACMCSMPPIPFPWHIMRGWSWSKTPRAECCPVKWAPVKECSLRCWVRLLCVYQSTEDSTVCPYTHASKY